MVFIDLFAILKVVCITSHGREGLSVHDIDSIWQR